MNKKVKQFAEANGLVFDNRSVYGKFNGYQMSVDFGGMTSTLCTVAVLINLGESLNEFLSFIEPRKRELKFTNLFVTPYGISFAFPNMTAGGSLKKAQVILQTVTNKLQEMEIATDHCPYCNQPLQGGILVTDGVAKFHAHEQCFDKKLQEVQGVEAKEEEKPDNFIFGILGAILGSLISAGLFILFYYIGYFASVVSLLGAFLASYFYSKFGGRNDKLKIVIVIVTTLIFTILAYVTACVIDIAVTLDEFEISGNPITWLFDLIAIDEEVAGAFWSDFFMCMLFYGLGVIGVVVLMIQQQKKTSTMMKKIGEKKIKINFLGDSITEGAGAEVPENMYSYLVCKHFGAEECLFGKGGTRIARQVRKTNNPDDEYFMTRAVNMPQDAHFTFVFGGTNDFGHGDAKLGERGDRNGYTFYGAFEELVAYLIQRYTKEKLCFILPLPRFDQDNLLGDGSKIEPVAPLSAYIAIEKEILDDYGIDYLDLSADFPEPEVQAATLLTVDGLHPNPAGYRIIADRLISYLEQKEF